MAGYFQLHRFVSSLFLLSLLGFCYLQVKRTENTGLWTVNVTRKGLCLCCALPVHRTGPGIQILLDKYLLTNPTCV
jgi:hypothetical protein